MRIGYQLAAEAFASRELIRQAVAAEQAGPLRALAPRADSGVRDRG
jgi:hypothetical protein